MPNTQEPPRTLPFLSHPIASSSENPADFHLQTESEPGLGYCATVAQPSSGLTWTPAIASPWPLGFSPYPDSIFSTQDCLYTRHGCLCYWRWSPIPVIWPHFFCDFFLHNTAPHAAHSGHTTSWHFRVYECQVCPHLRALVPVSSPWNSLRSQVLPPACRYPWPCSNFFFSLDISQFYLWCWLVVSVSPTRT